MGFLRNRRRKKLLDRIINSKSNENVIFIQDKNKYVLDEYGRKMLSAKFNIESIVVESPPTSLDYFCVICTAKNFQSLWYAWTETSLALVENNILPAETAKSLSSQIKQDLENEGNIKLT